MELDWQTLIAVGVVAIALVAIARRMRRLLLSQRASGHGCHGCGRKGSDFVPIDTLKTGRNKSSSLKDRR